MRLTDLVDASALDAAAAGVEVTGFAIDHRKVAPGTIFGAFRGSARNGEDYIAAAVAAGASHISAARRSADQTSLRQRRRSVLVMTCPR